MRTILLSLLLGLFLASLVHADQRAVFVAETSAGMEETYQAVYQSLESASFWVVFEADMGGQMARFAEQWGEDYNRNGLEAIRTMVVCNAWWTNQVANADPDMLAFCPLRVALTHKAGVTRVMFERPTLMAANSPALPVMQQIEDGLAGAINAAIEAVATP